MELCIFIQHWTIRQPDMIYQFEHLLVTVFVKKSISLISWECISLLCFHMTDRFIMSNFLKFYSEYLHFKKLSHFGAPLLANLVNSQTRWVRTTDLRKRGRWFALFLARLCRNLHTLVLKMASWTDLDAKNCDQISALNAVVCFLL